MAIAKSPGILLQFGKIFINHFSLADIVILTHLFVIYLEQQTT